MRISIADYGVGNLKSLQNAFWYLGVKSKIIRTPEELRRASKIVLPGVGAFGYAMRNIRSQNLETAIKETAQHGTPILGICLGMQLLLTKSDEGGCFYGLDLLPGCVKKMPVKLKLPHIGWNQIKSVAHSQLLADLPDSNYGYFVHSYFCALGDSQFVQATTNYGFTFTSVFVKENIFGVQFHPEKSQEMGLRILQNFAEM